MNKLEKEVIQLMKTRWAHWGYIRDGWCMDHKNQVRHICDLKAFKTWLKYRRHGIRRGPKGKAVVYYRGDIHRGEEGCNKCNAQPSKEIMMVMKLRGMPI